MNVYVPIVLVVILPAAIVGVNELITRLSPPERCLLKINAQYTSLEVQLHTLVQLTGLFLIRFQVFNRARRLIGNTTFNEARTYCMNKNLKLPDDPKQLAYNFDWWELADDHARNSKDGRVLFWSSVQPVYKNDELSVVKGLGRKSLFITSNFIVIFLHSNKRFRWGAKWRTFPYSCRQAGYEHFG